MERFWTDMFKGAATIAGMIAGMYGGWTAGTKVLVILMVMDYVLGCACAVMGKSPKTESGHFWSKVAFMGLLRKGIVMAVILVAALLDKALAGTTGEAQNVMFRSAAEFFYIATEALSIIENAGLMGVPVPKRLRQALEVLRDKNDEDKQ